VTLFAVSNIKYLLSSMLSSLSVFFGYLLHIFGSSFLDLCEMNDCNRYHEEVRAD
jgi:hypothetical protein